MLSGILTHQMGVNMIFDAGIDIRGGGRDAHKTPCAIFTFLLLAHMGVRIVQRWWLI